MLKKLYIHNYKCLVDFELELGPLNVFVGENGSGKSAVVAVLNKFAQAASRSSKIDQLFGSEFLSELNDERVFKLGVEIAFAEKTGVYKVEIGFDDRGKAILMLECFAVDGIEVFTVEGGKISVADENNTSVSMPQLDEHQFMLPLLGSRRGPSELAQREIAPFLKWFRHFLGSKFNPWAVRSAASLAKATRAMPPSLWPLDLLGRFRLAKDGHNFAQWLLGVGGAKVQELPDGSGTLFRIADEQSPYQSDLREAIPGLLHVRLVPLSSDLDNFELRFFFSCDEREYSLRFDMLSEGQRSLVFHYALLHFRLSKGRLVAFDEPDNFVALREVQPWLSEVSDRCYSGDAQAIIVSHHPEVVDYFGESESIFFWREEGGRTLTAPLNEAVSKDNPLPISRLLARGWVGAEGM